MALGIEITYKTVYHLSSSPFRRYHAWELPKSYEWEEWESDDDTWIKKGSYFYNLREFCTIGMPHIPLPMGGAQLAAGDFLIAGYQGEVWGVRSEKVVDTITRPPWMRW